jgi:hypothetical protein
MTAAQSPERRREIAERRREVAANARQSWRFKAAQERIRKIVDGMPPLSDEQRQQLALLLAPGSGEKDAG